MGWIIFLYQTFPPVRSHVRVFCIRFGARSINNFDGSGSLLRFASNCSSREWRSISFEIVFFFWVHNKHKLGRILSPSHSQLHYAYDVISLGSYTPLEFISIYWTHPTTVNLNYKQIRSTFNATFWFPQTVRSLSSNCHLSDFYGLLRHNRCHFKWIFIATLSAARPAQNPRPANSNNNNQPTARTSGNWHQVEQ